MGDSNPASAKQKQAGTKSSSLLNKEEEYRRINAELEARTAVLVNEADALLRHRDLETNSSLLTSAFAEDIAQELDDYDIEDVGRSKPTSGVRAPRVHIRGLAGRPGEAAALVAMPLPQMTRGGSGRAAGGAETAVDEDFPTGFRDDLHARVASLAEEMKKAESRDSDEPTVSDVLPAAAADLGLEAQNRFLKAKLRVLQEEMEKVSEEAARKLTECGQLVQRVKEVEEERNRLNRTSASQQGQLDKMKKLVEESKSRVDIVEMEKQALKKELESMKRSVDQQSTSQKTQSVRLQRAVEEADKLRDQLGRIKSANRESGETDRRRIDQLLADNRRLERQKAELIAGFKKQIKLIDVLKRQRMHIEAAKMLQFAEEEFVKALDWSS